MTEKQVTIAKIYDYQTSICVSLLVWTLGYVNSDFP